MYDLDHMLSGSGSRQHHQDMIRQAQFAKFAREVKPAKASSKIIGPLRTLLTAIITLVTKTI